MRKTLHARVPDLHCHSTFSLLDGFGSPKAVVERAKALGWGAACLTEHGWIGSAPPFYKACRENGINPILGCEFYVVPPDMFGVQEKEARSESYHLTVLALSVEGYQNLIAWNNVGFQVENFYYRPRISVDAMEATAPHPLHHNVVLSGCMGSELCQSLLHLEDDWGYAGESYIDSMKALFPNFYIEVQNHFLEKFRHRGFDTFDELIDSEERLQPMLVALAQATNTPIVVTNDSHYQSSEQRKAHIAMISSKMKSWRQDDAHADHERTHEMAEHARAYGYWTSYMRDMEEVADGLDIAQEAIDNVRSIAREADIRLDPLDRFSYSIPFSGYDDPLATIIKRCKPRLKRLIAKHGQEAAERFDHEMSVMGDFAHYLLIMSDLLLWAREQGILTNTRGSAANSIVCYCLKIHDIDSIEYKLLFSRFVNPARKKLPDIDVDMEKDRYEDFMAHVHEYMEAREGEGQVIQMCNYGTLANRATFRMVAEALGIEKEKQDEIAKLLPAMIDSGLVDEDTDVYAALKEQYPDIYELAEGIFDNLKNISQHACAWLLGTKERPLKDWVPVFLIASSKKHVTQFNMTSLDDMGLVKGDWLRLRTLSVIKRCMTMIGQDATDLESIPLDDPETFKMLREGRTDGVFTLQGKTNRQGCIECEVDNVHDVIASVAIYRPALTRPGLHRVYNQRRRGEEEVTYPHPVAEAILSESYGIPIFQEQVMDLGYAIGMNDAEVDDLYKVIKLAKGVGRFAKEAFEELRPTIMARACEIMTEREAENVTEIIGNSQGYGFNRGHASSYGRLAVRAAFLRCHHPQEFFTALLDVYPEVGRYVAAARSEGFRIIRPDVNLSGHGFSRGDDDRSIRIGLARIRDVGPTAVRELLAKRPFSSVDDLRERTDGRAVRKPTIEALAAVGALHSLGIQGSGDDAELLHYLSFLPEKPKAFTKDIKPKFVNRRDGDRWTHIGLRSDIEMTEYRTSISKLFWVPPLPEKELLRLKTSPWARVKTYLLTVVDENGIPFTIMANEDKEEDADYLKHIARRCTDSVICANGAIRSSFDQKEPLGFRLFDVAGAREGEPQVWRIDDERWVTAFNVLHKRKMRARRT